MSRLHRLSFRRPSGCRGVLQSRGTAALLPPAGIPGKGPPAAQMQETLGAVATHSPGHPPHAMASPWPRCRGTVVPASQGRTDWPLRPSVLGSCPHRPPRGHSCPYLIPLHEPPRRGLNRKATTAHGPCGQSGAEKGNMWSTQLHVTTRARKGEGLSGTLLVSQAGHGARGGVCHVLLPPPRLSHSCHTSANCDSSP